MLASPFITLKTVVKSLLKSNTHRITLRLKPSLAAGVSYFALLLLLGCSSVVIPLKGDKKNDLVGGSFDEMSQDDYLDHLNSLKGAFLATPGIKTVTVDHKVRAYLESVVATIIGNNEIFFKTLKSSTITILDFEAPLHLSLPGGEIFISKGLIAKYIKHESMLVSVLAYELVRMEKKVYPKETVVPVGYLSLERMINLNRLSLDEKMEVHKWAHHLTVRSGYDGEYYLSWLQIQNRNTADFILLVGDANLISREESLFKAFLIKQSIEDNVISKKNSSKGFYGFLNTIRDKMI